ncbi:hypothetical protein BJF85_03270 [Saccharomonospora sp. CUA-673]|uniref:DinB family protein n=1 Tax=Saccharomonospora sp. CUA-673 TaxID=1904969 RepID=UPI00096817D5|nr:DinB family protein [Saccharomonospora sp. CUA-673]OLT43101.1 hypothetical protein BJF85_03270 [Saccharomonospora sp. CUA-673]
MGTTGTTTADTAAAGAAGTAGAERERADLLGMLARQRWFLRYTARELDDEQANRATTVSALTVAGLIKHVAAVERGWLDFAGADSAESRDVAGAKAVAGDPDEFRLLPGETLAGLLDDYAAVARRTEEFLAAADLDVTHELPEAPWFEPEERWSVRQVLLHVITETSQHAGHADIIRETLDGQRTMAE